MVYYSGQIQVVVVQRRQHMLAEQLLMCVRLGKATLRYDDYLFRTVFRGIRIGR